MRLRLLLVLAAGASACTCGSSTVLKGTAPRLSLSTGKVLFGDVLIGDRGKVDLGVTDTGRGALHVTSIERQSGFPMEFHVEPQLLTVDSGSTGTLHFYFDPTAEATREGHVVLHTDDPDQPAVDLVVNGRGVTPHLVAMPASVDFGGVLVDDTATQPLVLKNAGTAPMNLTLEALGGDNPELFRATPASADPRHASVAAGASLAISLAFTPTAVGQQRATLTARPCASCDPVVVPLTGLGIDSALQVTPNPIDVGATPPGATGRGADAELENVGNRAVTVKTLTLAATSNVFGLDAIPGGLPFQLLPGAKQQVHVTFKPLRPTPYTSTLTVTSDDPRTPRLDVPVTGLGGGPECHVLPSALDFGTAAVGFPLTRRLSIANLGPAAGSAAANLIVSAIAIGPGTTPYSVALPHGQAFPLTIAPGSAVNVTVTYAPTVASKAAGDAATLTVTSSDALHPAIAVPLTGAAVALPPCSYALQPLPTPGLVFGVVAPGRSEALDVAIANTGATDCVIGALALSEDTSPSFSLKGGALAGVVLAAGKRLVAEVDFAPPASASGVPFSGALDLAIDSTSQPTQKVLLSGTAVDACYLTVSPPSIDFGKSPPGCQTLDRILTLTNACDTAPTILVVGLGTGPDNADFFVAGPPARTVVQPGSSIQVKVRFRACDPTKDPTCTGGRESGAIDVVTDQKALGGQPIVVPLTGSGAPGTSAEDDFTQSNQPEADILWVIDSSSSMGDKQQILSDNLKSFMAFAVQAGVDYHIGAIDTAPDATHGALYPLPPTSAPRIVTPQTADPVGTATKNIIVGAGAPIPGGGTNWGEYAFESMYQALTDPTLSGTNAGFLRPEAFLSIIIVGDEDDQSSPHTSNFYFSFFQNLKGPGNQQLVAISNISGGDQGCSGNNISATNAPLYQQATRVTGGVHEDLCTVNWARALQRLSLAAFGGVKLNFPLTGVPDPLSLKVSVDDASVGQPLWSYDQAANAIVFDPTAIPPSGAHVKVSYDVACAP